MASDSIPGNVRRTVNEAMDIEEGNPAQLIDPEVARSLKPMSETCEGDQQ
jgi:hypothetical protein